MNEKHFLEQGETQSESPAPFEEEVGYESFVPEQFKADPFGYFDAHGVNIKPGESKFAEDGKVREDVAAVKYLPVWENEAGEKLETVAKRINPEKGRVRKEGDPFYEYHILQLLTELGLPTIKPIAKIESDGRFMTITERAKGFSIFDLKKMIPELKAKGYSNEDLQGLQAKALEKMDALRETFEQFGIYKDRSEDHKDHWKIQDMIFDIDFDNKEILSVIPTDWEKTKLDKEKIALALEAKHYGIESGKRGDIRISLG